MASIPNMRSTPLPVPAGKTGAGEAAPGDFAAQLPIAQGQVLPLAPRPQPGSVGAGLVLPDTAEAIAAVEGEVPEARTEADAPATGETAKAAQPQPAEVVVPFLPAPPAAPGPQVIPTIAADEGATVPQAAVVRLPAAARARPGPAGKATPPSPAATDAPEAKTVAGQPEAKIDAARPEAPQVEPKQIEAAVKELLQRKVVPAKPTAAAPTPETAPAVKAEAPVAEAKGQVQPQSPAPVPAVPAAAQAPVPAPATVLPTLADQPQPALAPTTPLPASAPAAPAGGEAVRTADLAVERQLDLARDGEWLDRLARDIARAGSADTPLRFRLQPQTLGHLQVELQQGDHGTAVRLTVETEAARQLLADAQPRLAAEARAQGVRIAETHVDLSGSGRHAPGDQRRQDEAAQSPMIRTARGADTEAVASARVSRRDRLDRYA